MRRIANQTSSPAKLGARWNLMDGKEKKAPVALVPRRGGKNEGSRCAGRETAKSSLKEKNLTARDQARDF